MNTRPPTANAFQLEQKIRCRACQVASGFLSGRNLQDSFLMQPRPHDQEHRLTRCSSTMFLVQTPAEGLRIDRILARELGLDSLQGILLRLRDMKHLLRPRNSNRRSAPRCGSSNATPALALSLAQFLGSLRYLKQKPWYRQTME